jgi:hypothetical protein
MVGHRCASAAAKSPVLFAHLDRSHALDSGDLSII